MFVGRYIEGCFRVHVFRVDVLIAAAETNKRLLRAATAISTKGKPGGLDQEVLFDVRKPSEEVLANILVPQSSIFTAGRSKEALIKRSYKLRPPIFQRKTVAKPNLRRMELHHRMLGRILKAGIDAQASENMNKLRQYKEVLEHNFLLRATLQPAELLNRKLHDAKDTKLDTNSVFSTTTPIVAALSKSRFQVMHVQSLLLVLAISSFQPPLGSFSDSPRINSIFPSRT
jgi:hypothetical protein